MLSIKAEVQVGVSDVALHVATFSSALLRMLVPCGCGLKATIVLISKLLLLITTEAAERVLMLELVCLRLRQPDILAICLL